MSIFSEIYGLYYSIMAEILQKGEMSRQEILSLVRARGFSETVLQMEPKLFPGENSWNLLETNGKELWKSRIGPFADMPITALEKSWLKALLSDPRARLFLSDDNIAVLQTELSDVKPLFENEMFLCNDQYADFDSFRKPEYVQNFQIIREAIHTRSLIEIDYETRSGERVTALLFPLKIEYSTRDGKFRLLCAEIANQKLVCYGVYNFWRIHAVKISEEICVDPVSYVEMTEKIRCHEPIVVEIFDERNAIERFMIAFSTFEKVSEFDEERKICRTSFYYQKIDEDDIVVRLLGFGPSIKVIKPDFIVQTMRQRITEQLRLFSGD